MNPIAYPHLREPLSLGGVALRNRIMMAAHGPRLPQERYLAYIEARAQGGVGSVGLNVWPLGLMSFPFGPGTASQGPGAELDGVPPHPLTAEGRAAYDRLIPMVRAWAEAAQRHGAKAIGQLFHAGAAQHNDNFQPTVSASTEVNEYDRVRPHPLTGDEIGDLIEAYRLAARRAVEARLDALELHAAHGYLLQQFLSPLLNRRTDGWGGSPEARLRFPLAALRAVREGAGDALPVGIRLTAEEPAGGLDTADLIAIARAFEAAGAAYVSISGNSYSGLWRGAGDAYVPSALTPPVPYLRTAAAIRATLSIPVMVSGSIATLDQAEAAVAGGSADIACMVRALMADPALVAKGLYAQPGTTRRCIGGNECHYGRPLICAVNPVAGREAEIEALPPPAGRRRLLVAGAGPAGLETAIAAASRGHHVTLVERDEAPGGALRRLARISGQARFGDYVEDALARFGGLPIDLRLGTELDEALVRSEAPDLLVLATGARWRAAGGDAWAALDAAERTTGRVTVIGGRDDHLPPLVVADWFAGAGRPVTLLSECASPGQAVEPASLYALLRRLHERGVEIRPFTAVEAIGPDGLDLRHTLTNARSRLSDPGSIVDVDAREADGLALDRYAGLAAEVRLIGDALSPRRMVHATLEGTRMGLAAG